MTSKRFLITGFTIFIYVLLIAVKTGEYYVAQAQEKTVQGTGSNASKLVKLVKKTLDDISTFSCSFNTEQFSKSTDTTQHISGTIWMKMKKPFLFRMERPGNIIVIDGKTIWTYLPDYKQVQISDYDKEGGNFPTPYNIFNRYADERKAVLSGEEEIHGGKCDIISLVSDNPAEIKVTVWIDRTLHIPVKAIEESPSGDVFTHIISTIRLNENINESIFTFVPPEGVTKIDLRE